MTDNPDETLPVEQCDREDVHVLPIGDLREHAQSADCWCRPKRDDEEPRVVIHNSMDRREEYERGRAKH